MMDDDLRMDALPIDLECASCTWRAKNPTCFRDMKNPVCPACGGPLQSVVPEEPKIPMRTAWELIMLDD